MSSNPEYSSHVNKVTDTQHETSQWKQRKHRASSHIHTQSEASRFLVRRVFGKKNNNTKTNKQKKRFSHALIG